MALQLAGVERGRRAAILGAGGTAAAAAVALASLGAEHVDVVVRNPREPATCCACSRPGRAATVTPLADAVLDAPWWSAPCPSPRSRPSCDLGWRRGQTVLDVLYAGWPTPLAAAGHAAGGTVISGLEVLFWQATAQVELMTGQPAPIAAMRAALDAA